MLAEPTKRKKKNRHDTNSWCATNDYLSFVSASSQLQTEAGRQARVSRAWEKKKHERGKGRQEDDDDEEEEDEVGNENLRRRKTHPTS